ncbi:MAG: hypothetical protein HZA94_03600 [Candidatus Vogelbacteria bacterium]|nr:hypothetical protein [Candidatus Vogelbacteria bacterium]
MLSLFEHHANLLVGNTESSFSHLKKELEKYLGTKANAHSDYFELVVPAFEVEDSRLLREKAQTVGLSPKGRFFVISANSFTREAQNALLKLFEEPVVGHHFYILVSDAEIILPTLKSRMEISYFDGGNQGGEYKQFAEKFLEEDVLGRTILIEKLVKDEEGDEEKALRHKTKEILNQIEGILASSLDQKVDDERDETAHFLHELLRVKSYLNDTSPSVKMILEYLSFVCPTAFLFDISVFDVLDSRKER